ncbi:hypothetical protein Q7P37_005542 [Cladosporium fusiforme]
MADPIIEPYVKNTAAAIIRRDSNTAWDSAVERFDPPKPSPTIVIRTNRFKTFVNSLTQESKKPELNTFRLGQNFKISDVQREANAALQAYDERGNSLKSHFFRTLGRDFSNNASATEALLAFLPDGEYTFILCGALTLVFNAAKRIAKVREQILNCLGTLTRTVEGTKGFQQLYSGDKRLWETAESLYLALLDAVQDILAWLDDGAWRRTFSALFKQENYCRPLEDKIKTAVETRAKEFHEQLEYCQHERIQLIHIGVGGIARSVDSLQIDLQKVQATQQGHHEELTQLLMMMLQGQVYTFEWQQKSKQAMQDAFDRLAQRSYDPTISLALRPPKTNRSDVLGTLKVNPGMPENDSHFAGQYGQTLSPERQARAVSLLQHAKFQSWLKSGDCEVLVVNGKDPQSESATMSPLTYVIGLLAQTMASTQTAMPLVCICGRHASPDDPLEGAEGVLRLLIYQLLTYLGDYANMTPFDYNFIEAVKAGDIGYLRELFRSLIVSVVVTSKGPSSIVCLVDGVSFLETAARKPSLEKLVAFLQQLVLDINDLGGLLVFKVLLTYPYMSRYAQDWFPSESILTMGEESGGDRQGYNFVRLSTASQSLVMGPPSLYRSASEP